MREKRSCALKLISFFHSCHLTACRFDVLPIFFTLPVVDNGDQKEDVGHQSDDTERDVHRPPPGSVKHYLVMTLGKVLFLDLRLVLLAAAHTEKEDGPERAITW